MHKREATKTSDATFAQCRATKTLTATFKQQHLRKCEDKSPKTTQTLNQRKMSKLVEVIAQSTSPSPLLCWAHSANPSLEFCLAVKVRGEE
jgi:hypothetical protein